jgi:transcription elongation factor Elf1
MRTPFLCPRCNKSDDWKVLETYREMDKLQRDGSKLVSRKKIWNLVCRECAHNMEFSNRPKGI